MDISVLQIVRESSALLSTNWPPLLCTTLLLIFPVSAVTLSHVLATPLSGRVYRLVAQAAGGVPLLDTPLNRVFYRHLTHAVLSQAVCFPVIVTLWLLAKAAILYTLACSRRGKRPTLLGFLNEGPTLWSRLAVTHVWVCVMGLGFASFAVFSPLLLLLGAAEAAGGGGGALATLAEAALLLGLSVVFAHMVVVFNLAGAVSALEDKCGGAALLKALFLLKPKLQAQQPALLLVLLTTLSAACLECTFHIRVLNNLGNASAAAAPWEAPLLIFLYSAVYLFDTVMAFVFYDACLCVPRWDSSALATFAEATSTASRFDALEHFSIAVEMMEHCRKHMQCVPDHHVSSS